MTSVDSSTNAWIKLLLVPSIGAARFHKLVDFFGDATTVFTADPATLRQVDGIPSESIDYLIAHRDELEKRADEELVLIEKYGITLIRCDQDTYPHHLKHIYAPPPLLYVKGSFNDHDMVSIAIVGTRRPSSYGLALAQQFARELAERGITIVSGLAYGIDTAAHRGALHVPQGRTIAVVGSGLASVYPTENTKLSETIAERGVVISELPMNTHPDKSTFPLRNRIISGISCGVLVIEAGEKSGALITAQHALEQGKDVFAVPGNITNPRTHGVHALIKDGAKLVTTTADILDEIEIYTHTPRRKKDLLVFEEIAKKTMGCSDEETKVVTLLQQEDSLQIEEICDTLNIPMPDVIRTLMSLELKGIVKQLPGKIYCNCF